MYNFIEYVKIAKRNSYHYYGLLFFAIVYDSYLECIGRFDGFFCTIFLVLSIFCMSTLRIISVLKRVKYTLNGMFFVSITISVFLTIFIISVTSILTFTFVYHQPLLFSIVFLLFCISCYLMLCGNSFLQKICSA